MSKVLNAPDSLRFIRNKIDGKPFSARALTEIVCDIQENVFDPVHIAAFLTACAARPLDADEIFHLIKAMVRAGETLKWPQSPVVDKHCVGGLPGNRTTPIVVAIVAASGLHIPKTSSRAITSAAGTADTMEVFAPVDLDLDGMRKVVEREGGCVIWGGNVGLSPVDDELVGVARALNFDGHGQMVASVLSKKIAAGATQAVIDIPVGPTAKIENVNEAKTLAGVMMTAAKNFGLTLAIKYTDGSEPIGRGVGPALEARDVMAVLTNQKSAPSDLRDKALMLAGALLETGGKARAGEGLAIAKTILSSGKAWAKFQSICEAQGGMREIPPVRHSFPVLAKATGNITSIDNRRISRLAKAAGAPEHKEAGLELHVKLNQAVSRDQPIFTIHGRSQAGIDRVLAMIAVDEPAIIVMDVAEKLRTYI